MLDRFWREEIGATAIEYAFLVTLIALAIIGGVQILGLNLANFLNSVSF